MSSSDTVNFTSPHSAMSDPVTETEKKIAIYKCLKGTCKRLFRSEQNAEQHFCWNVKPTSSKGKTGLSRTTSSLELVNKQ